MKLYAIHKINTDSSFTRSIICRCGKRATVQEIYSNNDGSHVGSGNSFLCDLCAARAGVVRESIAEENEHRRIHGCGTRTTPPCEKMLAIQRIYVDAWHDAKPERN